ncbi:hypothetical protein GUITHDRAFT_150311 [Guillardia theta CCMP2712]|uniref:Deoxyhypusine hydroxylase n=1 Tax=Guillardia theta (strain CCMP2712) TaxID=905079 RepID=L1JZY5_GUITC|nr:hypothetical protein GUITHDRAFT_150311 [Guillardia theta CCMP2712]EKX53844.1 hypothetical protein GUITHDRAFT_150311 [Guillardia theta CCMP2712]|eukprot:XP_005840824.1 hypothetical protein GUITHDRAFT_150311 [Guillardia theta CCMP2712]
MTLTSAYKEDVSTADKIKALKERLLDRTQPLAKRMRVVCSLRGVPGTDTVDALAACLTDESALLRHEVAYALGQKEEISAVPVLTALLKNDQDSMVRHEAAEALGAIGVPEALKVLEEFESCDVEEVRHTCQLALDRIRWANKKHGGDTSKANESLQQKKFASIDPAPPADASLTTAELVDKLMDSSLPLFERYGFLFALRDRGTEEAALGLAKVLLEDKSSAVLRHEIAFVLGQIQNKAALSALETSLRNVEENQMVRHEAAEAIGAIAEEAANPLLEEFAKDKNQVVAESCIIALDISDYWNDDSQFQYAVVEVE